MWRPRELKTDILPYDEVDFSRVMGALADGGFIVKYSVEGKDYGYVPSWTKHQNVNEREAKSKIPEYLHGLHVNAVQLPSNAHGELELELEREHGTGTKNLPVAVAPDERALAIRKAFKLLHPLKPCPWGPAEEMAIKAVLKDLPSTITPAELQLWVQNYFHSRDGPKSHPPRRVIRLLATYAQGPLNEFGRLQDVRKTSAADERQARIIENARAAAEILGHSGGPAGGHAAGDDSSGASPVVARPRLLRD